MTWKWWRWCTVYGGCITSHCGVHLCVWVLVYLCMRRALSLLLLFQKNKTEHKSNNNFCVCNSFSLSILIFMYLCFNSLSLFFFLSFKRCRISFASHFCTNIYDFFFSLSLKKKTQFHFAFGIRIYFTDFFLHQTINLFALYIPFFFFSFILNLSISEFLL